MKKLFIFLCSIIITTTLPAQNYHPFIQNGKTWADCNLFHLLCVSDSTGTTIYENPSYNSCYIDIEGIPKFPASNALLISPNPMTGCTNIKMPGQTILPVTLLVYDYSGRIVQREVVLQNPFIFKSNNLSPGLYLLKTNGEVGSFSKKVLIE